MSAYAVAILKLLESNGHCVTLSPQQRVRVSQSVRLTKDLRKLIEASRDELIGHLKSRVEPTVLRSSLGFESAQHDQYIAHHFQCKACISAGQCRQGSGRCEVGAELWTSYNSKNVDMGRGARFRKFMTTARATWDRR